MSRDNWYRNTAWDKEIERNFEERLKRSRGKFHKAQYIRIQATYLLRTKSKEFNSVGIELLKRTISEYPNEFSEVTCALEQLGNYYMDMEDLDEAKHHFELIRRYKSYKQNVDQLSNLKLIEIALKKNNIDEFSNLYKYIESTNVKDLVFNCDKFYFLYLAANLTYKLGKYESAKKYAYSLMELLDYNSPQFKRYPDLGVIKPTNKQLNELKNILDTDILH